MALDRVAQAEGFRTWSLLSSRTSTDDSGQTIFARLRPGDLMLLAGRPGQGKTRLSFELIAEALRAGRSAVFFTLEFTEANALACFDAADTDGRGDTARLRIDTSDGIEAAHIIRELDGADPGTVAVVDYLQLLDQRRDNAPLSDQVVSLRAFARERGLITVCLSQIDRRFEQSGRDLPSLADVRLPNPLDLELFTSFCFLHRGRMRFARAG